jgi:hypothetical protein
MTDYTATFRDYNADNPEYGEFSLDTSGTASQFGRDDLAVIIETWEDDDGRLGQRAEFTREQAREIGTVLIGCTGDQWAFMLQTEREFKGVIGSLHLDVVDGVATVWVTNGPDFIMPADGSYTHDMGVRLIAWAGVAPVSADV